MAEEDDSQKTEDPSDRKLARAKQKGQTSASQEVKSWVVLLAGATAVVFLAPYMAGQVRTLGSAFIEKSHMLAVDPMAVQAIMAKVMLDSAIALSPFLLLVMVFAVVGNLIQSGLIFAPDKVKPDLSKMSPIKGFGRMFSTRALVEFLKGVLKLIIVGAVAVGLTVPLLGDIELLPGASMGDIMGRMQDIVVVISLATVAVMTVIAALDFAYQKFEFLKQMRMTKQEVKDEHKQSEGDPLVKGKIRALRQRRAQERMMANVPKSDVVITNPTHYAVALEYKSEEMSAPRLVAKGIDTLAFRIREVAEEHDIPIVENPPLARALHASVELDQEIPQEHFVAVAEVIGYVMRLKGKTLH